MIELDWVLLCTMHLAVCSYHVTEAFQTESALCIGRNVKEVLVQNRRDI